MLAIVVGLLLTVVVAIGIVVLVALPNLRRGSRILTPDGERAVKRAKQQAKQKPLAAAGSTWHGLVALKRLPRWLVRRSGGLGRGVAKIARRIGRLWAPVSAALHTAMDQLETRDSGTGAQKQDDAVPGSSPSVPSVSASRDGTAPNAAAATDATDAPGVPDAAAARDAAPAVQGAAVPASAGPSEPASAGPAAPASAGRGKGRGADGAPSVPAPAPEGAATGAEAPAGQGQAAAPPPAPTAGPRQERFDVARITGRSVGRPRPTPADSGPIPEIGTDAVPRTAAEQARATGPDGRVIDLREGAPSDADRAAGSARRAR